MSRAVARRSEEWAAGLIREYRFPARYEVERVIGRGGSGAVLAATDLRMGRRVAIKALDAASELTLMTDVADEARVLAALTHPNLVTVFDTFTGTVDTGAHMRFLVMQLIEGPDLAQFLRTGTLTGAQLHQAATQLVAALHHVHESGFLHRDIKPSNVLLEVRGDTVQAWLSDFGTAVTMNGPVPQGEFTIGTAAYLSPEQADGSPLTAASDVYSLGLVLLEAATGKPAFPGPILEAAMARLDVDPVVPVGLPDPLRRVLVGMTRRDPARRLSSTAVMDLLQQSQPDDAAAAAGPATRTSAQHPVAVASSASVFGPPEQELVQLLQLLTQVLPAEGAALLEARGGQLHQRIGHRLTEAATFLLRHQLDHHAIGRGTVARIDAGEDGTFMVSEAGSAEDLPSYLVALTGHQQPRDDSAAILLGFAQIAESALELRLSLHRALFPR